MSQSSDSILSDSETTADLSDKNCTGDELDGDHAQIPKVVSQSNGIGTGKRSVQIEENPVIINNEVHISFLIVFHYELVFLRRILRKMMNNFVDHLMQI